MFRTVLRSKLQSLFVAFLIVLNFLWVDQVVAANLSVSGAHSVISASPTSIPADGASTSSITVQIRLTNPGGNQVQNKTTGGDLVILHTTAGTLSAVTDNGNGTYSAILTSSNTVEIASITGTVNGQFIGTSSSVSFTLSQVALTLSLSASDLTLTRGVAMADVTATPAGGSGSYTSFTVSPALPAGLSLNSGNGTISGSPTAAVADATYTVEVTDSNGAKAQATISIEVLDPALTLSLSASDLTLTRGVAMADVTAT
ncbi:putative Ig domain-containing protein, partial [Ruegeria sp. WL0004]